MPALLKNLVAMMVSIAFAVWPVMAHAGPDAKLPRASYMGVSQDGEVTRFSADLSKAVGYNVYVVADPFRVIIDLPEIEFEGLADASGEPVGLVRDFRYGIMETGRSRIVLDASGPVLIEKSTISRHAGTRPARLVVDIVATSRETFKRLKTVEQPDPPPAPEQAAEKVAETPSPAPPMSDVERAEQEISAAIAAMQDASTVPIPRPKPKIGQAPLKRAQRPARAPGAKRVVVIDPGHGGIDPGAISRRGTKEKAVVLDFAKRLRAVLERAGKYKVILTRDKDIFISLRDRVKIARTSNADLFIAVHADSVRGRRARGATIYTVSEKASDREAEELARKENRSDIIAGVDLDEESDEITGILIDLAQRETNNHSLFFAKKMLTQMKRVTKMNARPLRSAGFRVLKAPDVPSVLFEMGYLSSSADERQLKSKTWQRKAAGALAASIDRYFSTKLAQKE